MNDAAATNQTDITFSTDFAATAARLAAENQAVVPQWSRLDNGVLQFGDTGIRITYLPPSAQFEDGIFLATRQGKIFITAGPGDLVYLKSSSAAHYDDLVARAAERLELGLEVESPGSDVDIFATEDSLQQAIDAYFGPRWRRLETGVLVFGTTGFRIVADLASAPGRIRFVVSHHDAEIDSAWDGELETLQRNCSTLYEELLSLGLA